MSLDYDLSQMVDREVNFPPEEGGLMNRVVYSAIWATIPVGISRINSDNVEEFYARWFMWTKINGDHEWFTDPLDKHGLDMTLEKARLLVGLSTNATPLTRSEFLKRMWDANNLALKIHERSNT